MKNSKEQLLKDIKYAIINNDEFMLKKLINENKNFNKLLPSFSQSFLHIAAEKGFYKIVQILLNNGADPNYVMDLGNTKGVTPLYLATRRGSADTVYHLLKAGVNLNKSIEVKGSIQGLSSLYVAVDKDFEDIAIQLIKAGADVNSLVSTLEINDNSILHLACGKGLVKTVKELISAGANVNAVRKNTNISPLYLAAQNGNTEIVKLLLNEGAKVEFNSELYDQPIDIAVEKGHFEIVQLLIAFNASLTKVDINLPIIINNKVLNNNDQKNYFNDIQKIIKDVNILNNFIDITIRNFTKIESNVLPSENFLEKDLYFSEDNIIYLQKRASIYFKNNFKLDDEDYLKKLKYFNKAIMEVSKNTNLQLNEVFLMLRNHFAEIFKDSDNNVLSLFSIITKSLTIDKFEKLAQLGNKNIIEKIVGLPLSLRPTTVNNVESIIKLLSQTQIDNTVEFTNSEDGVSLTSTLQGNLVEYYLI